MEGSYEERSFGSWLRRRRRALDLTQKRLAVMLRCSAATIRKIEREERRPSRGLAAAIGRTLGVPDEELETFVRFARAGWSDAPPAGHDEPLERPWTAATAQGSHRSPAPRGGRATAARPATAPPPVPAEVPTLVGREAELGRLRSALRRALDGRGQVLLITGVAGQGKTALIASFAAAAQREHPELLVATGTGNAFSGLGDPFLPFREALLQLSGVAGATTGPISSDPRVAERLQRFSGDARALISKHGPRLPGTLLDARSLHPAWAAEDGIQANEQASVPLGPPTQTPFAAHGVGLVALRSETVEVLAGIAQAAPLLLALDDLQWADTGSLELLLQLARAVPRHPLLLIAAFRPAIGTGSLEQQDPLDRTVHELQRRFGDVVLDLDRSDGRAFLEAWLDEEPNLLDPAFRASLWRQTSGNPLFTIELLRAMQERGDVVLDQEGRWRATHALHWDALPARVAGALAERVGRLDAATKRVLQVASIEGDNFTVEAVSRVLGLEAAAVAQTAAEDLAERHRLVAAGGVRRTGNGIRTRYRFRHNLIQRFVYEGLGEAQRTYLHEAVADALVELSGDEADPVALALHYLRADAPARAAPFQAVAGHRARASGALVEAVRSYRSALERWDDADAAGRTDLQRALGECLQMLGKREEAKALLEKAKEGLLQRGETRKAALTQIEIARATHDFGDPEQALRSSRAALDLLADEPECWELAYALSATCMFYDFAYDQDAALMLGERALAMARRLGAEAVEAHALNRVGTILAHFRPERRQEGIEMMARGQCLVERLDARELAGVIFNLGDAMHGLGHIEAARRQYAHYLDYVGRHDPDRDTDPRLQLWRLDWRTGRWAEALDYLKHLRERVTRVEGWLQLRMPYAVAAVDLDLGRPSSAHAIMAPHQPVLPASLHLPVRAAAYRELLRAASASRPDEADRYALALIDGMAEASAYDYDVITPVLTALAWLASRSLRRAERPLHLGFTVLTQAERQFESPESRAALLQARAALANSDGAFAAAARDFRNSAEQWRTAGFPLDEARARSSAGHALTRIDRGRDARASLARADDVLRSLAHQLRPGELAEPFDAVRRRLLRAPGRSAL